jgi:hypothetical protein
MVSFLTRRPVMMAAIITGVTSPPMIWRIREPFRRGKFRGVR